MIKSLVFLFVSSEMAEETSDSMVSDSQWLQEYTAEVQKEQLPGLDVARTKFLHSSTLPIVDLEKL
jgi:hypothetical protein